MTDRRAANPSGAPPAAPERPTTALLVLALMVIGFAAWMAWQRPSPPPVPRDVSPPPVEGLRTEAWMLPDDPLLGFVAVPGGPFSMGSDPVADPLAFDNERWPGTGGAQTVDVATFYIARHEVTVAQFARFVAETGHYATATALEAPPRHPITGISWPDALAYCRWLDTKLRSWPSTPAPLAAFLRDGGRVTLPTEAEWEKAARGRDGRIYPWGSEPRLDRAVFETTGPRPVGSIPCPECPYGLTDMSGNVWELTRSPFRPYPFEPDAPLDLAADALWVMRGGHFGDGLRNVRAAIRGGADPGARRPFIGFRVVISKT